ncbi:hypothetical protein C0993_009018 [Termitomyces sp. T159_Od127]|nr:hypothetical protein C0993_009018 [Termitomyces sp. T159_Od127]
MEPLPPCPPEDRHSNGLRDRPQGTMADHLLAAALPTADPPAAEAPQQMLSLYSTFALRCAQPQRIKDVLHLTPKQPSYSSYKALITQIDQQYWENRSKYSAFQVPWNSFENANWQTGAAAGNWTTGAAPPPNSTA